MLWIAYGKTVSQKRKLNKKKNRTKWFPFRMISRWSQKWKPPGFKGLTVYEVFRYITRHFDMPSLTERVSAISYNFIMAIPPTCLFLFTLIPNLLFFSKHTIKHQLRGLIQDIIPAPTYNKQLISFVDSFIDGSKIGMISFTFLLSLFFASNAVMGIMRSFNKKDYIGFQMWKGLKRRWKAIRLTLMLFGLIMVTFILLFLQHNILEWLGIHDKQVASMILSGRWVVIGSLIFFSFAFIYRYAPSTTKRWQLFSPGAIIATMLSIVATVGFSFFVSNFGRYNILYGSIGSIMVIMIMVFLNSFAIFIGFIINLSIHILSTHRERREHKQVL